MEKEKLLDELNRSMVSRRARLESTRSDDSTNEIIEHKPTVNYDDIEEIENEITQITQRTNNLDPSSPFAIAMSAKHRTLTKRLENN